MLADFRRRKSVAFAFLALATFGIVAAACSGDEATIDDTTPVLIVPVEPTALVFDPRDEPKLAGVSTARSEIETGECFNEYLFRDRADFLQEVTTIVSCANVHDREAYFVTQHPANETDGYPLDDGLKRWAESACLEEFEAFVGIEYVLSQLEIGTYVPTFEDWTDGERNVICYVYPDKGGRLLESVRRSEL